jgi:hypothetical protein
MLILIKSRNRKNTEKSTFKHSFNGKFFYLGRNIYYPNIFGHILNRKNQTFIKFGKILKEYFLKPRIGFLVFKNRSN